MANSELVAAIISIGVFLCGIALLVWYEKRKKKRLPQQQMPTQQHH